MWNRYKALQFGARSLLLFAKVWMWVWEIMSALSYQVIEKWHHNILPAWSRPEVWAKTGQVPEWIQSFTYAVTMTLTWKDPVKGCCIKLYPSGHPRKGVLEYRYHERRLRQSQYVHLELGTFLKRKEEISCIQLLYPYRQCIAGSWCTCNWVVFHVLMCNWICFSLMKP